MRSNSIENQEGKQLPSSDASEFVLPHMSSSSEDTADSEVTPVAPSVAPSSVVPSPHGYPALYDKDGKPLDPTSLLVFLQAVAAAQSKLQSLNQVPASSITDGGSTAASSISTEPSSHKRKAGNSATDRAERHSLGGSAAKSPASKRGTGFKSSPDDSSPEVFEEQWHPHPKVLSRTIKKGRAPQFKNSLDTLSNRMAPAGARSSSSSVSDLTSPPPVTTPSNLPLHPRVEQSTIQQRMEPRPAPRQHAPTPAVRSHPPLPMPPSSKPVQKQQPKQQRKSPSKDDTPKQEPFQPILNVKNNADTVAHVRKDLCVMHAQTRRLNTVAINRLRETVELLAPELTHATVVGINTNVHTLGTSASSIKNELQELNSRIGQRQLCFSADIKGLLKAITGKEIGCKTPTFTTLSDGLSSVDKKVCSVQTELAESKKTINLLAQSVSRNNEVIMALIDTFRKSFKMDGAGGGGGDDGDDDGGDDDDSGWGDRGVHPKGDGGSGPGGNPGTGGNGGGGGPAGGFSGNGGRDNNRNRMGSVVVNINQGGQESVLQRGNDYTTPEQVVPKIIPVECDDSSPPRPPVDPKMHRLSAFGKQRRQVQLQKDREKENGISRASNNNSSSQINCNNAATRSSTGKNKGQHRFRNYDEEDDSDVMVSSAGSADPLLGHVGGADMKL